MATSAPPPVSRLISATTSCWRVIEHDVGAHALRLLEALRHAVDADDERGAREPRAGGRAQADRSLREDDDRVADLHVPALRRGEARRHDVRAEQDVLVGEAVRDLREVRLRVRDDHVVGLTAVDGVAEAPAADRLVGVAAVAALRAVAREARATLAARRDRADDHAIARAIAA